MTNTDLSRRLELMVIVGSTSGIDPVEHALAAVRGGATAIQLRMKGVPTRRLMEVAEALRTVTATAASLLLINDRVDVALAAGADGAHLGDDDLPLDAARRIVPGGFLLGRSVDDEDEAAAAVAAGADYVGYGPIFPTPSKRNTGPVVGVGGIARVRGKIAIPIVAIGGIGRKNAAETTRAGADGIAVIGAVGAAPDPEKAARLLLEQAREGKRSP